jgi:hypothetical protein
MTEIYITLAVEDYLSEIVARKLLEQIDPAYRISQCLCKGGQGYLKSRIHSFNQAAEFIPFFVLTDQDRGCPPMKISNWLTQKISKNFLFRIAVMEIESWVMADREGFAKFISISIDHIPQRTDDLEDPKRYLLSLVSRSRSGRLRADIIPSRGSTATVGPDYNNRLSQFIQNHWNVFEAQKNSESLRRAVLRIKEFKNRFTGIRKPAGA